MKLFILGIIVTLAANVSLATAQLSQIILNKRLKINFHSVDLVRSEMGEDVIVAGSARISTPELIIKEEIPVEVHVSQICKELAVAALTSGKADKLIVSGIVHNVEDIKGKIFLVNNIDVFCTLTK